MSKAIAIGLVLALLLITKMGVDMNKDDFTYERSQMVENQLKARGIRNQKVLEIMQKVPRHLFVPENFRKNAYEDRPLSIGYGQTISQPFIVAFMTEAANIEPNFRVLEIGTGSGYQAAILSQLCKEVYTIELVKELGDLAQKQFTELGYANIHTRIGDGYSGWPEAAPFDIIIATAAPEELPQALIEQLKEDGTLIIPVGDVFSQQLMRITRTKQGLEKERLLPVMFVPMVKEVYY